MDYLFYVKQGDKAYQDGQAELAREAWTHALSLASSEQDFCVLGQKFLSLGFLTEAKKALSQCRSHSPSVIALSSSLALERGDVAESMKYLDDAFKINHLTLMSNTLLVSHYQTQEDPISVKDKSLLWGKIAKSICPASLKGKSRKNYRSDYIRIGFVSGDLCAHPVGFLIAPILQALSKRSSETEIFVFDNGNQNDWMTERLKKYCSFDHWIIIQDIPNQEVSQIIYNLNLDVLIDCSGHTSRSRLPLFINRLAPLQLSWGGYFSTTGLETIDAVILDPYHAPDSVDDHFLEKIFRIPSRFIYAPPPIYPPVTDMPYFRCGTMTFGSFNNIAKINERVIEVWSSILKEVPRSRLILKWRCFSDQDFCASMHQKFSYFGIEPERIELRPFSIYRETLAEYRDIDIALDPFPFTGGQTSLDALWMGIPLVTLAGVSPVARQGHAFVNLIGKPEWSSSNEEDYVKCAIQLAQKPDQLRSMRFDQRNLIYHSKLSDADGFVASLITLIHQGK